MRLQPSPVSNHHLSTALNLFRFDRDNRPGAKSTKNRANDKTKSGQKGHDRHAWKAGWEKKYGFWLRNDGALVWCMYCYHYRTMSSSDSLSKKTQEMAKLRSDYLKRHDESSSHAKCVSKYKKDNAMQPEAVHKQVNLLIYLPYILPSHSNLTAPKLLSSTGSWSVRVHYRQGDCCVPTHYDRVHHEQEEHCLG